MTHKPTGKIYIGALKNSSRWLRYNTSSKVVNPMLKANPEEWHREILLKDFSPITTWSDVVSMEQSIIEATSKTIGWNMMWNKGVFKCHIKGAANTKMPADHPWRTNPVWNKGVKMSNTSNMGGYRSESFTPEIIQKRTAAGQNTRANWTPEQKAENNRKVSLGKIEGWKRKKNILGPFKYGDVGR